ncbi:hypothetical protein N9381_06200 [Paracoccaceae bacterium]|nr:hypothetical protein [Paracoccaceae bacterium]
MRDQDTRILRQTQRAAAIGRLLLGELNSWEEFNKLETTDFEDFARRDLRANKSRFRKGINKEVKKFCNDNFDGMTKLKLEQLFLRVKARRGLELPLGKFKKEFTNLKPKVLSGAPPHCTVVISLWGLQIRFPEDLLSKDIIEAVRQLRSSEDMLKKYYAKPHSKLVAQRDEIWAAVRIQAFASRACMLACFNLVEAVLNGLAWRYKQESTQLNNLSNKDQKLLNDGVFRSKLIKYPTIITGRPLWCEKTALVKDFLDQKITFRDSLVHASPFSNPEKYGGRDKLEDMYRIDSRIAQNATSTAVLLLDKLLTHVNCDSELPRWFRDLRAQTAPKVTVY